jgi:hypothetical protein
MNIRYLFPVVLLGLVGGCAREADAGSDGDCEDPDSATMCDGIASAQSTSGIPSELAHSDADSPVPTWAQLTGRNAERAAAMARIFAHPGDERAARARFEALTPQYRRGLGLLFDKITNEGWFDSIDVIKNDPWDTAFHFFPRKTANGSFEQVMDAKTRVDRRYTENNLANGVFAYLNSWNHTSWVRAWMENDVPNAALHIGIFVDGSVEVHMETYNPLYTNGARLPKNVVVWAPGFGALNVTTWKLHRKWENDQALAPVSRTSANYYHFMKTLGMPLSF